ncbi:unnamed protein product [Cuscuta epithymum]|uniref:Uncharacterized protein n=1 Tax=Cuscuta epithymum TaxID=186058 RepID=A0AAV0FUU0_9ASTE|nr:unnamed protein product [Cuscuta epithymum]
MLNPLTLSWESFSTRLDYVVMLKHFEEPATSWTGSIPFQIYSGNVLRWDLRIPRQVVKSYKFFLMVLYFYNSAYRSQEPEKLLPLSPRPMAFCTYYGEDGQELDFEPHLEEEDDNNEEELENNEEHVNNDAGEVEDDNNEEELENNEEQVKNDAGEEEDLSCEESDDGVMNAVEWEAFLARLVRVEF